MRRAAFFGSNLVAGTDLHDPADRFSSLVASILGWDEVNLGQSGSRLTGRSLDGQAVDPASGVGRAHDVMRAFPDVAVMMFGEEDYAAGTLTGERRMGLGFDSVATPAVRHERRHLVRRPSPSTAVQEKPSKPQGAVIGSLTRGAIAGPGTFAGDLDYLLSTFERSMPSARIFVVSPPYRPGVDEPNAVGLKLLDYGDAARSVARRHEVPYVDVYRDSTIQPANFSALSDDGCVLNARGHQHLAAFLIEGLLAR